VAFPISLGVVDDSTVTQKYKGKHFDYLNVKVHTHLAEELACYTITSEPCMHYIKRDAFQHIEMLPYLCGR
jgi:hypothetical protein